MLEHFRSQPAKLKPKYLEGLHANEVAILPYYVANLNIEVTHAAIAGEYVEYPKLFVDTLDNTYALRKYRGHMDSARGSSTDGQRIHGAQVSGYGIWLSFLEKSLVDNANLWLEAKASKN